MKILKLINILLPFNNVKKNVLFYLLLSPIINCFLTNLYYYNCGGSFNSFSNILSVINPFTTSNPLCIILITLISGNLYLIQYIYIILILFVLSLFI
jgi:ACR3 family arsenite efflux pump ArsB